MSDPTPAALTPGAAETEALIAEVDAAFEAWCRSTDRLEALAADMLQLADAVDAGLADVQAELEEWL